MNECAGEPFSLDGGASGWTPVRPDVAEASRQWLAVHELQTAEAAQRLARVVLVCRIVTAVAIVGLSVVIAGATMTMPEGSFSSAMAAFILMLLLLNVVVFLPTVLFTALVKKSARLGRDASAGRMAYLERNFPGYWSCDLWERWHPNRAMALRGPRL